MKRECEVKKSKNSCEDNGERRPCERRTLDLTHFKSITKPVKSGGKAWGVKKISVSDDHCVEQLRK